MKETPQFDYPKKLRFQCERCGKCCGDTQHKTRNILLLNTEAELIAKETKLDFEEFLIRTNSSGPYRYSLKKDDEGKCCFLRDNSCFIYGIRPLVCLFYPFELEEVEEGRHVFTYTDECPCIGQGPELEREYFERLFIKSLKTFRKDTSIEDNAGQ